MRLTAALRDWHREHKVRVNCIVPDVIDSADEFADGRAGPGAARRLRGPRGAVP